MCIDCPQGVVVMVGRGSVAQNMCSTLFSFFFFAAQLKMWPMKTPEDNIFRAGDVGVIRSNYLVSKFPFTTVDQVIEKFRECATAPGWSYVCPY